MPEIVLRFARARGLSSDAIAWFGHSWPSHVDSVLEDGSLLGARLEGGVQVRPPGYATFSRVLVVRLPTSPAIAAAYYDFLSHQVGKRYDVAGIAAFVAGRNWRTPDSWYCSELVAAALEAAGYFAAPLATPSNRITPADLLLVLSGRVEVPVDDGK
jgi:uncharacterized protein YycO